MRRLFQQLLLSRRRHSAIDALSTILTEHNLTAEKITGIDAYLFERAFSLDNDPDPDSLAGAQHSIPFCLAVVAVAGKAALLPMQMSLLSREDIITLARKIRLFEDTDLTAQFPETVPAQVVVYARNTTHTKLIKYPKGDPANPMQWQAIEDKFRLLSQPYQDFFDVNKVISAIKNIEGGTINDLKYALETGWSDPI